MSQGEITTEIERFIRDHINSVEQLEVLLLLASTPQQEWSALQVSQKLYRQPPSIALRLEDLHHKGLLSVRQSEPQPLYSYISNGRQDTLIQGLEGAYRVRQDAVIGLIFDRPSDSMRAFSDAFRIRRQG